MKEIYAVICMQKDDYGYWYINHINGIYISKERAIEESLHFNRNVINESRCNYLVQAFEVIE